ncbi:MAG: DUF808 domain-containing protein [Betaproteobacteria bacterium]|nr:MAG: DUF808 domain-containing protein [Betaproteobacteria bacterium]
MASSLLVLLDDIATILDDVAAMSKVAAKKTAGVLGDDLALNANQVSGVSADRELPVVWAVAKGSFINKLILVPAALAISAFAPWAITPLLIVGGLFLCYEGFEKLAHKFLHSKADDEALRREALAAVSNPTVDMVQFERDKIKGAIRTDFILSAEIVVITLGTVALAPFAQQVAVVSAIALLMTVGVYGLVAGIVKLDDAGLYLGALPGESSFAKARRAVGRGLLALAPKLMKTLSVVGTAAMFLVGGGIIVHGWPWLHHLIEAVTATAAKSASVLGSITSIAADGIVGVLAGAAVLAVVLLWTKLFKRAPAAS